jgi:2-polyprenyl-3-methyl-5-hydroxy-6-metoxy-1,4-benzoquinol methylase
MCSLGWNATGIDLSPVALQAARPNAPHALLLPGTPDSLPLQGPYDLIVMQHVFEHIARPAECLAKCFDLLAHGGILCIAIPNIDSLEARVSSRFWQGLDVPRHLLHFREAVLLNLLKRSGYEVQSTRPQLMPSTLSESILMLLPTYLRRKLIASPLAHALYLLSILPAALSYLLGNRPVLEVCARKPAGA